MSNNVKTKGDLAIPKVERATVAIESLEAAEYNPRKLSDRARSGLRESLTRFGIVQEIVVNRRPDGTLRIVGGHQRVDVLREAGQRTVPVSIVEIGDNEEKALNLALNNPGIAGEWDPEALAKLLAEVQESLESVFTALNLDDLFSESAKPALADTDDADAPAPEPPTIPVTVPGDVWILGRHRICCGDSTDADDVGALLGAVKPNLMVTDPPYGVNYEPEWRAEAGINKNRKKMGKVAHDDRADWREAWALFPGDVAYVWHAPGPLQITVANSLVAVGLEPRQQIIWAKDRFALGRGHYHYQHEPAWYAVRKGRAGAWNGSRTEASVWSINAREDGGHGHSTQKPVECMRRPMENNSRPGGAVYDPFLGSGTSVIAGEQIGRCVYGMELNPAYVDVSVLRWQGFSGKKATLEGDGRTFDEVAASRTVAAGSLSA